MTNDALTFATGLLARGIELVLRNNRLWLWPAKAYKHLTTTERDFIREHRVDLKALAAAKLLPETTVVWQPPNAVTDAHESAPSLGASCVYCGRPCVGADHDAYRTLHHNDPAEIARRDAEATATMYRTMTHGGGITQW